MKEYYEAHITYLSPYKNEDPKVKGWKYSCIDGDPVLGEGIKSYLTKFYPVTMPLPDVMWDLECAARDFIINDKYQVVRTKIERVVYDNKWENAL